MKFLNRIKESFKGFTEKVRSVGKSLTQGIKQGLEKIKNVFKKEKREPVEPKPKEPPRFNWKDMIDNLISSLQSEFALYYRKANGQFDVVMYNVESLKWQSLDILDQMDSATEQQFNEIQSIIEEVVNTKPSEMSQEVIDQMFANINAVLKGGTYISQTLGEVTTDGTPFDGMDE
nr:MAG TPA: hypothetical protein [Bacteriophage sp.]